MNIIGWLSALLLACCGIPQCIKSYKEKNSRGISGLFIVLWTLGEILGLIYVYNNWDIILFTNYLANSIFCCIILWYKCFPGKGNEEQ